MPKKGLRALFFVGAAVVVAVSGWLMVPRPAAPLPTLWVFYARAASTPEVLWARHYSDTGHPLGAPIRVGPLGLVQETEVAAPGVKGAVYVTLGWVVAQIQGRRVAGRYPAPRGQSIVSIAVVNDRLYGVAETEASNRVRIMCWNGRWTPVAGPLPLGITTLLDGPHNALWAMTATPDRARLEQVTGGRSTWTTPILQPQGTAGFSQGQPVVPYALGATGFGYWTGQEHRFASVYQAAVSVTDTHPVWGLGVHGMVPFQHSQFQWQKLVRWPASQATTPNVIGTGPWIAVLDGFSQGSWFNVKTGRFGPSFQIKTPWWAVVRAASLGS